MMIVIRHGRTTRHKTFWDLRSQDVDEPKVWYGVVYRRGRSENVQFNLSQSDMYPSLYQVLHLNEDYEEFRC